MFFQKNKKKYIIYMQPIEEINLKLNYPIDCFIEYEDKVDFKYKIKKFFKTIKYKLQKLKFKL